MADTFEQLTGLSSSEVEAKLSRGDRNRFVVRPTRTYSEILKANVFSLYNIILIGSFLILLILRGLGASIFPAAVVLINMILGIVQEVRAKQALDKLATLSIRTVTVRREGKSVSIPIENVVRDDVIELTPGDSVVVDGPILVSESLEIDESQLSGESEYVPKPAGERVLSGSFCVSGKGLMRAENIGNESFVNNLAEVARAYKNVRTPLEQELDALVKVLIFIMIVLAPLTLVNGYSRGLSLGDSFENLVNLMSSLVPQGLIVFVAISFAYGVINISRFKALIQRPNAIESIGHITCLCADKTGTLTQNILTVKEIIPVHGATMEAIREKIGVYTGNISWQNRTVAAIAAYIKSPPRPSTKTAEIPFNSERKWSSVTLQDGETLLLGTPELLLKDDAPLRTETERLSQQGLRLIAFATTTESPDAAHQSLPSTWTCIALIALQDQLRPDICDTLNEFAAQKVDLKIISGDSPETVTAIARQSCMEATSVLTGPEIDRMDDLHLDAAIRKTNLFVRIAPLTKRRIIASLSKHEYVAMIGDGVNDVPALKQAHIAIAMNDGAQIAKDVSDITLLNNAFSTLPKAFREGKELTQRIYGIAKINLVKVTYLTILFVLTGYIGLGWPANLIQTTWLSLITLTAPALLIIFRILPTPPGKNEPNELIRYILTWGIIGAIAMILMEVVVQVGMKADLALSRTMIIAFDGLFNSIVLWDVYAVTPFSPRSFITHWKAALAGVILGAVSALVPVYLLTSSLGFERLGLTHWAILGLFLVGAYVTIYLVQRRPRSRLRDPVSPDHPGHLQDQGDDNRQDKPEQ